MGTEEETQPDPEESLKSQNLAEHWSQSLRCTICFGYLREPHSLECGHTFCKRCLKRLAKIAKEDNPNIRIRQLSLSCPTCRHPFPAKPVLGDKLCTNIVLNHLVEIWKKECVMLSTSCILTERSICCQTSTTETGNEAENRVEKGPDSDTTVEDSQNDLHEEYKVRMRPVETYCQIIMQKVTEFAEDDSETSDSSEKVANPDPASTSNVHPDNNISSESESSVTHSEREVSQASSSTSTVHMPDLFMPAIPRIRFTECSPSRILLMAVWCVYSIVIVGLAETFLPYVILFTLFFFLVVLG